MTDYLKLGMDLMRAQAESLGFPKPGPSNVVPLRRLHAVPDQPTVVAWGDQEFPPTLDDYLNGRRPPVPDGALAVEFLTSARDLLPVGALRARVTALVLEAELVFLDGPEAS